MNLKKYITKHLPARFTFLATHIKKTITPNGFSEKTYSGNGEDILLTEYLFKNVTDGFYLDVGCFHPKHISNTYALHKKGWRGINIDPNPECITLFNKYRKKDINILAGVAEKESELTYYNFSHSGTNTFSKEHADKKNAKEWSTLLSADKVRCYPLRKILDDNLPPGTSIDMMDIDVEELDLEVLKSNNWDKYRPKVILVEDRNFKTELQESETYTYLLNQGYSFYSYMEMTLIMTDSQTH